jgi:hypothetical protein
MLNAAMQATGHPWSSSNFLFDNAGTTLVGPQGTTDFLSLKGIGHLPPARRRSLGVDFEKESDEGLNWYRPGRPGSYIPLREEVVVGVNILE